MAKSGRSIGLGLCAALILCLAVCGSGTKATHREKEGFYEEVKSVITEKASISQSFGTWVEGTRHAVSALYFDAAGQKIEEQQFTSAGTLTTKKLYVYDEGGRLAECREVSASGRPGNLIRYEYDAAGNPSGFTEYTASGEIESKALYQLDDAGNVVAKNLYDSDGALSSRWTSTFDSAGHEVETQSCGERRPAHIVEHAGVRCRWQATQEHSQAVLRRQSGRHHRKHL
jgi:YD repeat-containing protein